MSGEKANFEYAKPLLEFPLFVAFAVRNVFIPKKAEAGRVLIVIPCLIGEFAAAVPAIRAFIEQHSDKKVDLLVSEPLPPLARKIRGVERVFSAVSAYGRAHETSADTQALGAYERTIVLRASPDTYRRLRGVTTGRMQTAFWPVCAYAIHVSIGLIIGRTPRPWADVNFRALGVQSKRYTFEELFNFTETDFSRVKALTVVDALKQKIVIHTRASWVMNRWKLDNWVTLLQKLHALSDFQFIFVGGSREAEEFSYIASQLDFEIHSLIGQLDLVALVALLRISQYFIGVDSGPRNLAHLTDTPSVTLLGPGPHMFTPPNSRDVVIDKSGGRGLFERYFTMKQGYIDRITPAEVYEAFKKLYCP